MREIRTKACNFVVRGGGRALEPGIIRSKLDPLESEEGRVQSPTVKTIAPGEQGAAISTIVLAFATDPVARWCWPDPDEYLAVMPDFTRAFGGGAFDHGSGHATSDCAGAALWLPPGAHPDEEAVGEIMERTMTAEVRDGMSKAFEQMGACHPSGPHWYLPLIGVDPLHQGKGLGAALLRHALAQCDREHLPAYLESSNPRNISLYQRHGFEVLGTIETGGPALTPMLRRAR